jgi:hypothetical protein
VPAQGRRIGHGRYARRLGLSTVEGGHAKRGDYPAAVRPGTTIAIVALLVLILGAAILQFVFKLGG